MEPGAATRRGLARAVVGAARSLVAFHLTSDALLLATFAGTVAAGAALVLLIRQPASFSPAFHSLLVPDLTLTGLSLASVLAAAVLHRVASPALGLVRWAARRPLAFAAGATVLLALAARFAYHAHPFSMDEYAVAFQSRAFAAGRLTGLFPVDLLSRLVPGTFQGLFLDVSPADGRVASAYWPGFALLMTPFAWAGVPWLCNPVLTGGTLVALAATLRRIAPDRPDAPGWALLLAVGSPAFFVLGISFYAMTSLMLANLLYTWGFLSPSPRRLFLAGVLGSLALFLHNPLPHLLFAAPWVAWLAVRRRRPKEILALGAGYAPLSLLLGVGWLLLRGSLTPTAPGPAEATSAASLALRVANRFAVAFQAPDAHVLYSRLAGIVKLWLWAVPGLVVLAAWGGWRRRRDPFVALLAVSAVSTLLGYVVVTFDQGHGWGYRYFHSAWAVLPLLAALALTEPEGVEGAPSRLRPLAVSFALAGLLVLVPAQLTLVNAVIGGQMRLLPPQAWATDGVSRVTVVYADRAAYSVDLVQNDPFLRGPHVRMLGTTEAVDDVFVRIFFPGAREEARSPFARVFRFDASSAR